MSVYYLGGKNVFQMGSKQKSMVVHVGIQTVCVLLICTLFFFCFLFILLICLLIKSYYFTTECVLFEWMYQQNTWRIFAFSRCFFFFLKMNVWSFGFNICVNSLTFVFRSHSILKGFEIWIEFIYKTIVSVFLLASLFQ